VTVFEEGLCPACIGERHSFKRCRPCLCCCPISRCGRMVLRRIWARNGCAASP
jgi:hypothetical protein